MEISVWDTLNKRKKNLKETFWSDFGWNFINEDNIRILADELDNLMINNEETSCHSDRVIAYGPEIGVWLSSHYFDNREGIRFSFDAPEGIGFAGWASAHNLGLILDAFENWMDRIEGGLNE